MRFEKTAKKNCHNFNIFFLTTSLFEESEKGQKRRKRRKRRENVVNSFVKIQKNFLPPSLFQTKNIKESKLQQNDLGQRQKKEEIFFHKEK